MKTLEEAAEEYAAQERTTRSEYGAFVAGVKFAQRWTNVRDQLPEPSRPVIVRTDDYITGGYHIAKRVVIMDPDTNELSCDVMVDLVTDSDIPDVQFWRYIELK